MSFILDALKKAEAERHLGNVPSLHAQPGAALPPDAAAARRNRQPWLLTAGVLLIAACITLAWFKPWQSVRSASIAATLLAGRPAAPLAAPAWTAPVADRAADMAPKPEIVAISPAPLPVKPAVVTKPKPAAAVAKERRRPIEKPLTPPVPAKGNASDADLKLSTTLNENTAPPATDPHRQMPEHIQRELPKLAIGGYIYSENQRERQLLVNRRLLHEGEEAAPGVILEKMLPKAAVFNYKGYRYQLAY